MAHVNRIMMIVVLLVAIVVCGLVIRKMDTEVTQTSSQVMMLEMQVTDLQKTMQSFQTSSTQEIDALNADITTLETLVNDLGLQVAN